MNTIPIIDFTEYNPESKKVLQSLHDFGVLLIKVDSMDANDKFLDLMEKYSTLPLETKKQHVRRNLHYQVGLTPEFIEKPRDRCDVVYKLDGKKPNGYDPKTRWFHRMTPIDEDTEYTDITGENIIPNEFPEWESIFNGIGDYFMNLLEKLNQVISIEMGQKKEYLANMCHNGNHMIAPTMSDLTKYGNTGTILAGFHSDISLMTIHGKSRYSGLNIWTRKNEKIRVHVPDGCFLVQAGRQLEYITGGYILSGYHEVVVEQDTVEQLKKAIKQGTSTTRVSSTFFAHINSDKYMEVLPQFQTDKNVKIYPRIQEGKWLRNRLQKLVN